jgi:Undecaprenyl-phosphate galactose phosphotransferase WbaP
MSDTIITAMKVSPNGGTQPHASNIGTARADKPGLISRQSAWALFSGDLAALATGVGASDLIATQLRLPIAGIHHLGNGDLLSWGALVTLLGSGAGFAMCGHYNSRIPRLLEASRIMTMVLGAAAMGMAVQAVVGGPLSILTVLTIWLVSVPLIIAGRSLTKTVLRRLGRWSIPTLVLGSPDTVAAACLALRSEPSLGFEVIDGGDADGPEAEGFQPGLSRFINQYGTGFVVVAPGGRDADLERDLIMAVDRTRIPYTVLPLVQNEARSTAWSRYIGGGGVRLSFARPVNCSIKSAFDLAAAAVLLVVLAPVFVCLSLLIRFDGGPAFFTHRRIGNGGRRFQCLKFRTMVTNADVVLDNLLKTDPAAAAEWAATQKLRNDPRITRLGQMLRKTSLDELPQLFNVLRGEMSLVGPRPIVETEIHRYGDQISYYMDTRPGMTGLWQVSGRSETTYDERVRLDVRYVREWSLLQDVTILFKTISVVLKRRGAA